MLHRSAWEQVRRHGEKENRDGEDQAHPEAAGHGDELGVLLLFGGDRLRLQVHAADGAGAGTLLHHLGVHGAGVLPTALLGPGRLLRLLFLLLLARSQDAPRVGDELLPAALGAEVPGLSPPFGAGGGLFGLHVHSANRIFHEFLSRVLSLRRQRELSRRWVRCAEAMRIANWLFGFWEIFR